MISESRYKALVIIRDNPGITPGLFAKKMWPDSPSWHHRTNNGHGSVTGAGIRQAGGAYMGKLRRDGLLEDSYSHGVRRCWITQDGELAVADYESSHPGEPAP